MTRSKAAAAIVALLWLSSFSVTHALAWRRPFYEDAEVVERSELIVVARLKPDSIKRVEHAVNADEGRSWEHHATLTVTAILKGDTKAKELPIVIHYGLDPEVDDKGRIAIFDTGGSIGPLRIKDAREENIWCLRHRSGIYGREPATPGTPGTGNYGIVDPEDVQPLALKSYLLCYLSKNPEQAVKDYLGKDPSVGERATRFLDHQEIQRVLKIQDVEQRVDRLMPYYLRRYQWDTSREVSDALLAAGDPAARRLMVAFHDPAHATLRYDIIYHWGRMKYKGCVDELIELLKSGDPYWDTQTLKPGWWNDDRSPAWGERREKYSEIAISLYALREIGNPRARAVIELTRQRWQHGDLDGNPMVEACDAALKSFPTATVDHQDFH